jgi:lipopolysaccharide export LptBFGC system permease protein LptF
MTLLKKILVAFLILIAISTIAYFLLLRVKYSISEIKADNYQKLLTEEKSRSLSDYTPLSEFFKNSLIFIDGKKIGNIENWSIDRNKINDGYAISFLNKKDDTYYILKYKDETSEILLTATISNLNMDNLHLPEGKDIIQRALKQQGFIYSESDMKNGSDILIKEFAKDFLIGQVMFNDNREILSINFQLFSRRKYFN